MAISSLSPSALAVEGKLECRVLTDFAELEELSTDWTRLQTAMGKGEIFQYFAWVAAWWQSLGKDCRLFTPVVLRQGRIVGILPLVLTGRRLRFLGYSVSDYNHFLAEPFEGNAALEVCLDTLRMYASEWDEILLENIPESSLLAECIRSLPGGWQRSMVRMPGDPCPTLLMADNKQDVLKSSMDKLKRAVNRLRRMDKLTFRHIVDPTEAAAHLPQFFKQHIRRSAMAGRRSGFLDEDYVAFYKNLLERVSPEKEIRFSVLELGGRAIAYHFGSLFNGKYLWYKPSFDVDLWELAPGQAMLWHLFEYLQTADVHEFDFARGDEAFKYRFSNHVRQNLNFTVYASGYRSAARRMYRWMREAAKELVRKSPVLERALKAVRGIWQDTCLSYRCEGAKAAWRKLLCTSVFDKEELWVVSIDSSNPSMQGQYEGSVNEISLGGLADLAMSFPDTLKEDVMLKARELLRQKKTAWITSFDGSEQMLVWTSVGTELTTPTGTLPLPETVMLIHEIRPLMFGGTRQDFVAVLRRFASIAGAKDMSTWAVCPKRFLPSERALRERGVNPEYRWVRTRILGKTYSKQREFG